MRSGVLKISFAGIWIVLVVGLIVHPTYRDLLFLFCQNHPIIAPFALVATQIVFASFALPCSTLTVLAGLLWGLKLGLIYSALATVASSCWTFAVGRLVLRRSFVKRIQSLWYLRILKLVDEYKWKASMIAHGNPAFPGSSLGYVFGMSNISFKAFLFGAIVGTLPLQVLMVSIGRFAKGAVMRPGISDGAVVVLLLLGVAVYTIVGRRRLGSAEREELRAGG